MVIRSGSRAEPLAGEPRAGPAEAGDHLVGDEEDVVPAADLAHARQVARWRRIHPAGPDHRLAEEGGDPVGAQLLDGLVQRLRIVPRHVLDERHQRQERVGVGGDAAERGAVGVHPVVGVRPGDADLLAGPAHRAPVGARELGRGVHRVRSAAGGEEDLGARQRDQVRDPAGELLGGRVGEGLEHLVGGEPAHLLRRGVGELAPAVPDVAVPEAGEGVQVGTPVRVEDPGAFTPGDRHGVPGQAGHVREPVPQRWLACGITRSWHHRASFPR